MESLIQLSASPEHTPINAIIPANVVVKYVRVPAELLGLLEKQQTAPDNKIVFLAPHDYCRHMGYKEPTEFPDVNEEVMRRTEARPIDRPNP